MGRRLLAPSALIILAAWGATRAAEAPPPRISADALRRHVAVLASDDMAGRAPGTAGARAAADYLRGELAGIGLEPLGAEGGFDQPVPMLGVRALPSSRLVLERFGEQRTFALGTDYVLLTSGDQTLVPRPVPVVFVGYGIVAPELDHDDYADVDVAGKVVVYLDGEPSSAEPGYFAGDQPTVYASPEAKQRTALARGAAGSILLPLGPAARREWAGWTRWATFEQLQPARDLPRHLSLALHPALAEWLLADSLHELDQVLAMQRANALRAFHLPVSLRFEGRFTTRPLTAPNLVARLPGADPRLSPTAVVVVAHYDHLGVGPEVGGDSVYNGAMDNAVGVAGTLEIARAISRLERRPRRSLLVVLSTGEEAGLLGTRHFVEHPPLPRSRMVAAVNVDGLAFLGPFGDLIAIGGELSDLGPTLARAVRPLGLEVSPPPEGAWSSRSFTLSDQLAFAEVGIPAVMVNEGFAGAGMSPELAMRRALEWMSRVYHSPLDDLAQPLDWNASARHAEALLRFVMTLLDDPRAPEWRRDAPYAYVRALSRAEEAR